MARRSSPRTWLVVLLAAALAVGACGGGGGPTPSQGLGTPKPLPSLGGKAKVRFVNLYGDPSKPAAAIAIYDTSVPKASDKAVLTVPYKGISDFVQLSSDKGFTVDRADATQPDANSVSLPAFPNATQVTVVVSSNFTSGNVKWQIFNLVEGGTVPFTTTWPDVPATKASILVYPGALQVLPDALQSFYYLTPGKGCLTAVDPTDQDSAFSGNQPNFYTTEPGKLQIAAASDSCTGTPVVPPASVDVQAGDRVFAAPYGLDAKSLGMFLLDIGPAIPAASPAASPAGSPAASPAPSS